MKTKSLFLIIAFAFSHLLTAQNIGQSFFNDVDRFLKNHVEDGLVDYSKLAENRAPLENLINTIAGADISNLDYDTKQAFLINAYNLNVINKVCTSYPTQSVAQNTGFFTRDKVKVAGKTTTLNNLEKEDMLKVFNDPRYHFVLVCGALGCPPITDFAYTPENLDEKLNQQTRLALNNPEFIKYMEGNLELSEIFKWYPKDFGGSKSSIISFINEFRSEAIPQDEKVKYYDYDWTLNDSNLDTDGPVSTGSNASRYIVSSTIPKGTLELKVFNNLYSQQSGEETLTDRSSFFTTSFSTFYGLSNRFNIGVNGRYRKVRNNALPSSPFSVFGSDVSEGGSTRSGLTAIGPQIRYAPIKAWKNFSIQSSFVFAIGEDLAGNDDQPFIDWNGGTWWTQFFNDFSIGNKFSLFTEIDFLIEDFGQSNRISTPATLIFSYVPTNKLTIYTLGGYSPIWVTDFDYFYQYGVGSKYQFTPNFEIEILYTDFTNEYLDTTGGVAETINLGIRVNI